MIMFWNRYEVYVGFSIKDFNNILNILASSKIKYVYRTVNCGSNRRSLIGSFGENLDYKIMYYIYVHKKDAETTRGLLKKA